ncbi:immunomodulatory protein [Dichomitus squalens]|uniref:Immunomodulatory protein n=1 Tax=Dichomitus squalens TaxID=114155 RepID=A0A4Q9MD29_9APHY|nr:immunomodulatory protein [Dichomitus squalens LYAD-421 SS1]EJF63823.1 immunomodulatory protein [Dichomitus squalens LYAD-421 SS1]TBU23621.1 immunomodulatory protein [Dichomitus squalens]TBU36784.1 immunomodulatory protein [Dichomitus squalens]TBU61131.1 immunomodulatory protein [Dichomitus squalens]
MVDTSVLLALAAQHQRVHFDYTPAWGRGSPASYVDNVTFPHVLDDKAYQYRVIVGDKDLGLRKSYSIQPDGSQKVNFLEYNGGYGIADSNRIRVYVVDPESGNQYLIAQWN